MRFPTTTPEETLERTIEFFRNQEEQHGALGAIGIAAFGPLDLNPDSPTFGYIAATPKPGWSWTNLLGSISQDLGLPVSLDTDVNVAALGEGRWGAARGMALIST
jgi:fructokinase